MKRLQKLAFALVLIASIAGTTLGGDIPIGKASPPPDPPPSPGKPTPLGIVGSSSIAVDAALNVLQELLLVF